MKIARPRIRRANSIAIVLAILVCMESQSAVIASDEAAATSDTNGFAFYEIVTDDGPPGTEPFESTNGYVRSLSGTVENGFSSSAAGEAFDSSYSEFDWSTCDRACCDSSNGDSLDRAVRGSLRAYADFFYLRPRDAEVAFGVEVDGPISSPPPTNPIQIGRVGVVDSDAQPGFRAGFEVLFDIGSYLGASYSHFESSTSDGISTVTPDVIRSVVSHPSSSSASTDFLFGVAGYDIDFDTVELDFRKVIGRSRCHQWSWFAGARYAKLDQGFQASFSELGTETVRTNVDFEGGGPRIGLDGRRFSRGRRLFLYARGAASFVAGRFKSEYLQTSSFDPIVVDTSWNAGRVVTILDFEAGIGWSRRDDRVRISTGYIVSSWLNTVKTDQFIEAVQANSFDDLDESFSFDGLVTRLEMTY